MAYKVIEGGGITSVGYEYFDRTGRNPYAYPLTRARMNEHVEGIGKTLENVFAFAKAEGVGTGAAANRLAEQIFKAEQAKADTTAA